MDDKNWSDKLPTVGRDFAEVKDSASKQETQSLPIIATKAELDMRKAARNEPASIPHLTIGGNVEKTAHQKEFNDNERMIEYLERRLTQIDLEEDFDRAR